MFIHAPVRGNRTSFCTTYSHDMILRVTTNSLLVLTITTIIIVISQLLQEGSELPVLK